MKILTSITISQEIKDYCKSNNIKLSSWIEDRFTEEFFNLESKLKRKLELENELNKIKSDIKELEELKDKKNYEFNKTAILWLRSLNPNKVKSWKKSCDSFNTEFDKKLSIKEFKKYVEEYK